MWHMWAPCEPRGAPCEPRVSPLWASCDPCVSPMWTPAKEPQTWKKPWPDRNLNSRRFQKSAGSPCTWGEPLFWGGGSPSFEGSPNLGGALPHCVGAQKCLKMSKKKLTKSNLINGWITTTTEWLVRLYTSYRSQKPNHISTKKIRNCL